MNQADGGREAIPPDRSADYRDAARALDDMVAETERLGLYDEDPEALREALKEARAERGRTSPHLARSCAESSPQLVRKTSNQDLMTPTVSNTSPQVSLFQWVPTDTRGHVGGLPLQRLTVSRSGR